MQCQAKCKSTGQQCRRSATEGKRVCRVHGGASTGPRKPNTRTNALKHGIYSAGLTDEEQAIWGDVHIGHVDDEIRLCRIKLRRAMMALKAVQTDPTSANNLAGM